MYTDYTKLWKLLLEKQLTKTDLCRATGISTRTLAKLVANRSVTTDTLLTICETLDCDISDIMEFTREEPERSLFSIYREHAKKATDEGALRVTEFEHLGTRSFIASRRASHGTNSMPSASPPSPRATPYVPPPFLKRERCVSCS